RPDVGWRRQRRGDDQPLRERGGELRHAAELEYVEILVGVEAVFLHEITQGEIGRRAESGDTHCFAFQIADGFDLRNSHHVKRGPVDTAADEDQVGTAENRADHWGAAGKSDLRVAGQNHTGYLQRGGNIDQLHVEPILRKNLLL